MQLILTNALNGGDILVDSENIVKVERLMLRYSHLYIKGHESVCYVVETPRQIKSLMMPRKKHSSLVKNDYGF